MNTEKYNNCCYINDLTTVGTCGEPDDIVNGTVNVTGTAYNNTALYACYVGYHVASGRGDLIIQCLENGTWSGTPPVCEGMESKDIFSES